MLSGLPPYSISQPSSPTGSLPARCTAQQAIAARKEREAAVAKAQMEVALGGGASWGMQEDAFEDMDAEIGGRLLRSLARPPARALHRATSWHGFLAFHACGPCGAAICHGAACCSGVLCSRARLRLSLGWWRKVVLGAWFQYAGGGHV